MSLQGTLETIPLPDVLALLAATRKTGELLITGPRGDGRLWLDAGKVVGADVPRAVAPVDAVFELLRLTTGSFTFGDGSPPAAAGEPLTVDSLLAEAQGRLDIWKSIEAVVPSMACTLRLIPELGAESVTVSRGQWRELVAVSAGGDVSATMKHLAIGEYDACLAVKNLVDAGLVQVGKAPAQPVPAPEKPAPSPPATPSATGYRSSASVETAEAPTLPRRPAPTPPPAPGRGAGEPAPRSAPVAGTAPPRPALVPGGGAGSSQPRPVPVPGRAAAASAPAGAPPANAAPVVASGGRSAAPRRATDQRPGPEEAEELTRQLATLGKAHAKVASPRAGSDPADGGGDEGDDGGSPDSAGHEGEGVEGKGEEPINRGMLLKFLSSVRP